MGSEQTRRVIERLYEAFLSGDAEGMLAVFSDDIELSFLGQGTMHGIAEARAFFNHAAEQLTDLEFDRKQTIIDGSYAAVIWTETARTKAGAPWVNHGVDVFEVRDEVIVSLHENNDVRLVREHFETFQSERGDET